jgi:general secretion pathway protein D
MGTKMFRKMVLGLLVATVAMGTSAQAAGHCSGKLFNVKINSDLTIADAVENLAAKCDFSISVKDSGAAHKMKKKLYFVNLKNATLKSLLDTLLKDNDLNYELRGNKLTISYLMTRTFKIHYVTGQRTGKSSASVTVAGDASTGNSGGSSGGGKGSSISIQTNQEFQFWSTIKSEIHHILATAGDGGTHFTKVGDAWIGPDGQKWEYNPMEPIVNPEAGMITVTGTVKQLNRVSKYLSTLMRQIKTEVMIDVRILSVKLDNGRTTGIDWSQLYGLQNIAIDAGAYSHTDTTGLSFLNGVGPAGAAKAGGYAKVRMIATIKDVVKFLNTQGDVKAISSPRVMTMNNQPALISVGQEIFYKLKTTNQLSGADNAATEGEDVKSVFAGILLDITPEVDERGIITLKINPSISQTVEQLKPSSERTMPPDLVRRQIASVIKVKDGDHAILGGLITRGKGTKTEKVPLLGDLPLLGYAFKKEEIVDNVEELVVIITPHIIKNGRGLSLKDMGYTRLK